ncbi:hypothetical protein HIM_12112 [Hirsutella minnesotensis 3608]|uniref:Secretory phospholipase A2 n=1 Tax=Hirsutella minnesotensis 3608 TaxID=1043627 RepID=A0A0F7ZQU9_9HYPO|nr:hypothetical protein HIM_12112 [Hirsutella minnesotensis 3608]
MNLPLVPIATLLAAAASALPAATDEISTSVAPLKLVEQAKACSNAATDRLLFQVSIKTFVKARKAKNPSQCNWSSDNCSKSPDKIPGFVDFTHFCQRHDFGYRNTKAQKRFTPAMKKRIDDNFKKDMYQYCARFSGLNSWRGVACRRVADTYYAAVRRFGKRDEGIELDYDSALVELD